MRKRLITNRDRQAPWASQTMANKHYAFNNIDTKESMSYRQPKKQTLVLQAKRLFRVSHFDPAGIALATFYIRNHFVDSAK